MGGGVCIGLLIAKVYSCDGIARGASLTIVQPCCLLATTRIRDLEIYLEPMSNVTSILPNE